MLDLFTKIVFETVDAILKIKDHRSPTYKRAAKAFVQLHWMLWRIEDHSRLFLEALNVIIDESRIPFRMQQAVESLQGDVHDLYEMLSEDIWGWPTEGKSPDKPGFWGIISVYDNPFTNALTDVLGHKCTRLRAWDVLLEGALREIGDPELSKKLLTLPRDAGRRNEQGTIWHYSNGMLRPSPGRMKERAADDLVVIDLTNETQVQEERKRAEATIENLHRLRDRLASIIKERFDIKDLL